MCTTDTEKMYIRQLVIASDGIGYIKTTNYQLLLITILSTLKMVIILYQVL